MCMLLTFSTANTTRAVEIGLRTHGTCLCRRASAIAIACPSTLIELKPACQKLRDYAFQDKHPVVGAHLQNVSYGEA